MLSNPKDKDSMKYDNIERANILQQQFTSVFTREPEGELPTIDKKTDIEIHNLLISTDMVLKELMNLKVSKSCGPDELHPRLLTELCNHLAEPIALIFNTSMRDGRLPYDWKRAFISPIFKKGSKHLAENYRPISLTSILCKIIKHLMGEKLLSTKQYGFINGRSTTTQLLYYLDNCMKTIVDGGVIDTIYLDFCKAFDTVPHRRLVHKLEAYGIKGQILSWITAFLQDRSQEVVVNGDRSSAASVISGIPQGTVLGPVLFVIYINDLLDKIDSEGLMFADDTKIFHHISSYDDSLLLQNDIESLEDWASKWLLSFHPDKCHVLTIGKFENIQHAHRYEICGNEIEHVFDEKDLGVTLDGELRFDEHVTRKVRVANAIVGQIRRSFSYLDCNSFRRLYTAFVRPHLEYAQAVWSPHLRKQVNILENVQIRATKLVNGLGNLDYQERLKRLKLPTLVYRRRRGDMIEIYKHFHVYDRDSISSSFQPTTRPSRQHDFQLYVRTPRDGAMGIETNSFYQRTVRTWNNLPSSVVDAKCINSFKNKLDEHWKNDPVKYEYTY